MIQRLVHLCFLCSDELLEVDITDDSGCLVLLSLLNFVAFDFLSFGASFVPGLFHLLGLGNDIARISFHYRFKIYFV